jgi:hypothetical protein
MDFPAGTVAEAVERSIAVAEHLTTKDAAAVSALRALAERIDNESRLREALLDWANSEGRQVQRPKDDNVSIPTFLKYCESLGLTPAGRKSIGKKEGDSDSPSSGVSGRRQRAAHLRTA